MTRTPPPPPRQKRFINAESYESHRRTSPVSPSVAAANSRGFGPRGRPRQNARRAPRAQRKHVTSREGVPFEDDRLEEEEPHDDDVDDGGDDDGENGDDDGGGHPAAVLDLTSSPTGNREDNPIEVSSDSSSHFEDDEDPEEQAEAQPLGNDIPGEQEFDELYDAATQPRSPDRELYPEVNTLDFSREADDQLSSEFQQSLERDLDTTGIVYDTPQHRDRYGDGEDEWGGSQRSPAETPRRHRTAGPPSSSIRGTLVDRPFGYERPPALPPLGTLLRQNNAQRRRGENVDGVDHTPSRTARSDSRGPGNGQQRGTNNQQRQNTADLSDYKSSASPEPEHPAVRKLDDCERERSGLKDALRHRDQGIYERDAEISRLQGEIEELRRQNDNLRRAKDASTPEYVQGEDLEDVFFDEPDDRSDVDDDVNDALQRCEQLKASLRRRKDEWKDLAQRAIRAFWRLNDQYTEQTTRVNSLNEEVANLEEGLDYTRDELDEVREERDVRLAELNDLQSEALVILQQNQRLQQENDQAQTRNRELEQVFRGLQERLANLENGPDEPRSQPQGDGWILEEECDERRQEDRDAIADLETTRLGLDTQLAAMTAERHDALVDHEEARAEMEELQAMLHAHVDTLQAENDSLRAQVTTLRQKLRDVDDGGINAPQPGDDCDKLQKQLQTLREQYHDIKKQLDDCQRHCNGADADRSGERLRQDLIDQQKEMQSTIDDLSARLKDADARLKSAESTSSSRKRKRGSSGSRSEQNTRAELEARIESLEDANTKLDIQLKRLQKDLDDCRKHRQELEHRQLADAEEDDGDDGEEGDDSGDGPPAGNRGGRGGRGGRRGRGRRGGRASGGGRGKRPSSKPASKPERAAKPATKSTHTMALRKRNIKAD